MMKILFAALFLCSATVYAEDPFLAETPSDTPAPSLGSEAPSTPAPNPEPPKNDLNLAAPSAPEAQVAVPISSIPGKTEGAPKEAATGGKDIYDIYDEYLDKEKERQVSETDFTQRALFPHENGAWQLSLAYHFKAFPDYDFSRGNPRFVKTLADTSGPGIDVLFFPLHSLKVGRFGVGPSLGYYWSNFTLTKGSGDTFKDKPKNGSMYTYGVKAQYEFDYWLGQIVVPYVFVGFDQIFVKGYTGLVDGSKQTDFPSYRTTNQSYGGGLRFNLNRVEPVVASRALVNVGIRKFYLTYVATQRLGEFSGLAHSLGLTFEF